MQKGMQKYLLLLQLSPCKGREKKKDAEAKF